MRCCLKFLGWRVVFAEKLQVILRGFVEDQAMIDSAATATCQTVVSGVIVDASDSARLVLGYGDQQCAVCDARNLNNLAVPWSVGPRMKKR